MTSDPQFTAGAGGRHSCWRMSELRDWFDLGFFDVNETQDIENYCSFIGAYDVLSWFRDVVPVVHGPLGCVASFSATRVQTRRPGQPKPIPYCTGLTTTDAVRGGAKKLRDTLLEVDARERPRLIVVLPTCVPDVVGDDVQDVLREVAPRVQADLRFIPIAGSTCKGFRDGGDAALGTLIEYAAGKQRRSARDPQPSVNLFTRRVSGRPSEDPDVREAGRMLGKVGIRVNQAIRMGSTTADLAAAGRAWANAAFCFTWGDAPMEAMQRHFGQPFSRVSYPVGLRQSIDWVDDIARLVQVPRSLRDDPEVAACERAIARARDRLAGRVAYVWHSGEKSLALARFADEIGLRPHLIALTYWMQEQNKAVITSMVAKGQDYPIIIKGWLDLWQTHRDTPHAKRPLLFMPKKFWVGELPTVTVDVYLDGLLGLAGMERLLAAVDQALGNAGAKDYSLFDRYVERRYRKTVWNR